MDQAKFFEETMVDRESGLAVRLIAVPAESLAPHARSELFEWPALLGLTEIARLSAGDDLAAALGSVIDGRASGATELAQAVLREPLAFPATKETTLATLGESSDGQQMLALVALGAERLLLGAATEGLVLCGRATACSTVLRAGLAARIREAMGLEGESFRSVGPAVLPEAA